MRKHTISAARLLLPMAAMTFVVGLAACGSDAPPPQTVTRSETTRTTTVPGYIAPMPTTTGTTTTQTTVTPVQ